MEIEPENPPVQGQPPDYDTDVPPMVQFTLLENFRETLVLETLLEAVEINGK